MAAVKTLEEKIDLAWFAQTGQSGGFGEWLEVRKAKSQEGVARHFGVSLRTASRWDLEWRERSDQ